MGSSMPWRERRESGKPEMGSIARQSRLRALNRLLRFALADAQELGLTPVDDLLEAASVAISDELDNRRPCSRKTVTIAGRMRE